MEESKQETYRKDLIADLSTRTQIGHYSCNSIVSAARQAMISLLWHTIQIRRDACGEKTTGCDGKRASKVNWTALMH